MKNQMTIVTKLAATAACSLFLAGSAFASAFDGGLPSDWTKVGGYGTLGADGIVTASPEGGSYGYVSTYGGQYGAGLGLGSETTGSYVRSNVFSAAAGEALEFYFNYVTSDGSGFADYAWARLLDSSLTPIAVLFTARTTPNGNSVPGFGMAPIVAITTPSTVTITPGAPLWSALGANGNGTSCYANGCGYTDWVKSEYQIASAGDYILEFGVVNWSDSNYQSGMAFDGITIGGTPITPPAGVPEPASLALLGLGLAGIGAFRRRK